MKKSNKATSKKSAYKSLLEMAGEKAEAIKESFISGKDKVISAAEDKLEAVKHAIHEYTAPAEEKKKALKATIKKAIKKVPKKKVVKKAVKKATMNK